MKLLISSFFIALTLLTSCGANNGSKKNPEENKNKPQNIAPIYSIKSFEKICDDLPNISKNTSEFIDIFSLPVENLYNIKVTGIYVFNIDSNDKKLANKIALDLSSLTKSLKNTIIPNFLNTLKNDCNNKNYFSEPEIFDLHIKHHNNSISNLRNQVKEAYAKLTPENFPLEKERKELIAYFDNTIINKLDSLQEIPY